MTSVTEEMIKAGVETFRQNIDTDIYEPILPVEMIVK